MNVLKNREGWNTLRSMNSSLLPETEFRSQHLAMTQGYSGSAPEGIEETWRTTQHIAT